MIDDLKINEALKKRWYDKGYWTHDTIADIWERTSAAHPDREYVCDDTGSRLTYGEVDDKAGRVAACLIAEGIKAGDVVTLQFPTWAEFTIAYVAVLKVGGVVHPVPRNYNDVDLEYAMNLVGSRAYLSPTFSHNTDFQHGHIDDGKLGPGGELQGDDVAGFYALGDKPCGHSPGFVVYFSIGEAASRVVADVLAIGVRDGCALPDVGDGVVRPIPLGVPTFSQRLVDLQVVDHVCPFCSLIGRYQSPGGPNLMATIIQTMEPKRS